MFLAALRRGDTVLAACAIVGISSRTAYRHREPDSEFANAWDLASRMHRTPLELAAFERGVIGIEEQVYRYGKLSHTRRHLSNTALMKLLDRLDGEMEAQVAAQVAALGEELRGEIVYFTTRIFDRLLDALAPALESSGGGIGVETGPKGPENSSNPVQM